MARMGGKFFCKCWVWGEVSPSMPWKSMNSNATCDEVLVEWDVMVQPKRKRIHQAALIWKFVERVVYLAWSC